MRFTINEVCYKMKRITRTGILSLIFLLAFMCTAALAEGAAAGRFFPPANKVHVFVRGISIQAKHNYKYRDYPIIHLNRHELTLRRGRSFTLKASLLPSGRSVSVKWISTNPKIARVSSFGRITALAPGTTMIWAESNDYFDLHVDHTGYSAECCVIVPGGPKAARPIGINDRTYYYEKYKFAAVTSNYNEVLTKIEKSIGGYKCSVGGYGTALLFGSEEIENAHTYIYIDEDYGLYRFFARGISPLKTSRGIAVGAMKSSVQQKYGLPTLTDQYTEEGINYEVFIYRSKALRRNLYTDMSFTFLKGTVYSIDFYLGGFGDY